MTPSPDANLVAASLSGNRDAFGEIVGRYQSLVCSLAYSATGSLTQSEDLAQETFVTAWKQLAGLREPAKLRSWLCGIARNLTNNALRRQGREPAHAAESLEDVHESPSPEPMPSEGAISKEEESILWRSLERIPETYREPLVLFYREHQSVEKVAAALELSEDAVKQRLSRGRKLLHEQVLAFVEGTLERTSPGKIFTIGVLAALPAFATSATAATMGATAAKGSVTAKAAAVMGLTGALLGPVMGLFGGYVGYRMSLDNARSEAERDYVRRFYRLLLVCIFGFFVLYAPVIYWKKELIRISPGLFTGTIIGFVGLQVGCTLALTIWGVRRQRTLAQEMKDRGQEFQRVHKPAWEYRSRFSLLGLPFIHMSVGGSLEHRRKPIKAWIASGDRAIGVLIAFGGIAIAPVSIGGCAVGLFAFGGCALGLLSLGGLAIGIWAVGGLGIGWEAFGGMALAWKAALGGCAFAHDFALGGTVRALNANNELATQFVNSSLFFQKAQIIMRHFAWLHLFWVVPMVFWWRKVRRVKVAG